MVFTLLIQNACEQITDASSPTVQTINKTLFSFLLRQYFSNWITKPCRTCVPRNRIKGQIIFKFSFRSKIWLLYALDNMVILFECKNSLLFLCISQFQSDFAIFFPNWLLILVILDFCMPSFCILNTFVKACFHSFHIQPGF